MKEWREKTRRKLGVRRYTTTKTKRLWVLIALLVVACGVWAVLFRTNLMPDQKKMVSELAKDILAGKRKGLIRGIVSSEGTFTALIDGQAVREGNSIDGVIVVTIRKDHVEFEKNGKRWTQGLNEAPGPQWQADAEIRAQAEARAKAKAQAQAKARADAEAKAKAEAQARAAAAAKAKADADAKAQQEAQARAQEEAAAKAEAERKAQEEAAARAQAEAKARADADAKAQQEAQAKAKGQAEAKAKTEAARIDEATQERIAVLIRQLGDKEPSVRASTVATLAQIGPPAVAPLIAAMEDGDWIIRQGASQALGRIGDPRAVEPLMDALGDKNEWIRRYAAEALGLIGDDRAIEPLVEVLEDDSPNVRAVATKALVSIRGFAAPQPQAQPSQGKHGGTVIGKLIDLKIYVAASVAAFVLLGGLAIAMLRRRKRIAEWGLSDHQ